MKANFLEKLDCMWEIIDEGENEISLEISWGDWKHDHMRANYLASLEGWDCVNSYITEDDGSDTYSAVHVYRKG